MHVWGSPLAFSPNLKFASILQNVEWVEYPGVKLHCFDELDKNYYSNALILKNTYTNINLPLLTLQKLKRNIHMLMELDSLCLTKIKLLIYLLTQ